MRLNLYQKAVYWAHAGDDAYGKPRYASPVQFNCRWEAGVVETIGKDGTTTGASATVYYDGRTTTLAVAGLLFLGTLAQATASGFGAAAPHSAAKEIINVGNVPSLRNTQSLGTAHVV